MVYNHNQQPDKNDFIELVVIAIIIWVVVIWATM